MKTIHSPVTSIMTNNVIFLDLQKHTIEDAEKLFRKHKIKHLPVVDHKKLVGILSLTDLQRLSFINTYGADEHDADTEVLSMLTIEQVMLSKPTVIQANQTIKDVAEILSHREFHALPVVRGENLIGIVTTTDLIKLLLEESS